MKRSGRTQMREISAKEWQFLLALPINGEDTSAIKTAGLIAAEVRTELDSKGGAEELAKLIKASGVSTIKNDGSRPIGKREFYRACEALNDGAWVAAEHFLKDHTDLAKTHEGRSLWQAIAHRDEPNDLERLLSLGAGDEQAWPYFLGAPRLLGAWRDRHPEAAKKIIKKSSQKWLYWWLATAMMGSFSLREEISKAAGIDKNPESLHEKYPAACKQLWQTIMSNDSPKQAQTCISCGWGVPDSPDKSVKSSKTIEFSLIKERAWRVLDWWLGVPEFKKHMINEANLNPELSWVALTRKEGPDMLSRMVKLGIEVTTYETSSGSNMAHIIFHAQKPQTDMIDWWVENCPGIFGRPSNTGKLPLHPKTRATPKTVQYLASMNSYAQQKILEKQVAVASEPRLRARL
jgi:hypothetical protein